MAKKKQKTSKIIHVLGDVDFFVPTVYGTKDEPGTNIDILSRDHQGNEERVCIDLSGLEVHQFLALAQMIKIMIADLPEGENE